MTPLAVIRKRITQVALLPLLLMVLALAFVLGPPEQPRVRGSESPE